MAEFDCYAQWGFSENPFQPSPLTPNDRGERLLVGRDNELTVVKGRLHRHGKITCVEGNVGIGKTSLVNIATYQCLQGYMGKHTSQLLIPCRQAFQVQPNDKLEVFAQRVFLEVAQTLLEQRKTLRQLSLDMKEHTHLDAWLNSPKIGHIEAGFHAYFEIKRSAEVNTAEGFNSSGFEKLVRDWLIEIFPAHGSGAVVCIIDNLELLETAHKARKLLEGMRDRLFNIQGLRWVFCGANGIVSSVIASPRLSGYLIKPVVTVESLRAEIMPVLLDRRVIEFSSAPDRTYLPILDEDLRQLYWIINFNLRDLLAQADDYCMSVFESGNFPKESADKQKRFKAWLDRQTIGQYADLRPRIPRDAWELLDTAMSENLKGTFGPGDFNFFKRSSYQIVEYKTFIRHLRRFEDLGVLARSTFTSEDAKEKRELYTVTSKGCLVHYARFMKNETHTMATTWLRRVGTLTG